VTTKEKTGPATEPAPNNINPGHEFTAPADKNSTGDLLTAALAYAKANIPTFFLSSSKRPLANCRDCNLAGPDHSGATCDHLICHGHLAATCDPDRLRQMSRFAPHGMLAVRTGAVSGLVVIDVDPRNGGNVSLGDMVRQGLLTPTKRVITGANGQHLLYRHPGQHVPSRGLPGWPGIDVKGDGGYVVAPPSIHPRTGRRYAHADDGRAVVEMTPPLVEAVVARASVPVVALPTSEGIRDAQALLRRLLDTIERAPEGRRRTTLYGASRGVARIVAAGKVQLSDAMALLQNAGSLAEQSPKDIHNAVSAAFRAEGVAL
jgi:Bifunctional DNA primase/polymerase, N-terminal